MEKSGRLIFNLIRKAWYWAALSILLGFTGAIFNGVGMTLVIPIVVNFLGIGAAIQISEMPAVLRSIFSVFDGVPAEYRVVAMMGAVFLTIVLKGLANYATALVAAILSRKLAVMLRRQSFEFLLELDLQFFSQMRLGDLMNYINTEVTRTAQSVSFFITIAVSSITISVFLMLLVAISWQLTVVAVVILGLVAVLNQLFTRYAKRAGQELSKTSAEYSIHLVEILSGIRLIKSVANEEAESEYTNTLIENREKASFNSQIAFAAVGPINEISSLVAILALVISGRMLFTGNMELFSSIILTYLFVLTRMLPFISQLYGARNQFANASPSVKKLEYFLNRNDKPIMQSGDRDFAGVVKEICFKDLWFQYPQSDQWNLQDINIVLPKGKTLALVGSSGAGKSTMADLLARFYDPSRGRIEIDGIDLREFDVRQYRRQIGIVSQDTFLFNASVRDNIKYGYPQATDEEVFRAAKLANAADFISQLSQGFDTQIGDRGVMLSGGQRQRLSIARALLQNPEVLILDEATSALDTVSERLVQQALENLSHNRTTLVIAHRLSTIQKADQIVVLEKGKIVEIGTHQSLLEAGKHYAQLHSIQFSENSEQTSNQEQRSHDSERLKKDLSETSYKIRSQLSGMLGLIELFSNDSEEPSDKQQELTTLAYQSSSNILRHLEILENKALSKRSSS